jgi:hypothetical protein
VTLMSSIAQTSVSCQHIVLNRGSNVPLLGLGW